MKRREEKGGRRGADEGSGGQKRQEVTRDGWRLCLLDGKTSSPRFHSKQPTVELLCTAEDGLGNELEVNCCHGLPWALEGWTEDSTDLGPCEFTC